MPHAHREGRHNDAAACWGACALLLFLSACDDIIYSSAELAARKEYDAIAIGLTEESLIRQLGPPKGKVVFNRLDGVYEYSQDADHTPVLKFRIDDKPRDGYPPEIVHIRRKHWAGTIMIYGRVSVWGYYYMDTEGRVAEKVVFVG
ncbi:MAG: hypothetical protein U0172_02195 [Nitrospiraceae bacterium]